MNKIAATLLLITLTVSKPALAWDLGDIIGILTEMNNLQNMHMPKLDDIKRNTGETVTKLDKIHNNLNNLSGYEKLLNTDDITAKRKWSDDKWSNALELKGDSSFKNIQRKYEELYPVDNENLKNSVLQNNFYKRSTQLNRTALAASEYSYDTINEHMDTVNKLLRELANSPTVKQATDLNARLLAEISFIQLEMLKQQNIQTQLIATQNQNVVNGLSDAKRFNRW